MNCTTRKISLMKALQKLAFYEEHLTAFHPHNHGDRSEERSRNPSKSQSCAEPWSPFFQGSSSSFAFSWHMLIECLLSAVLVAADAAWRRKTVSLDSRSW